MMLDAKMEDMDGHDRAMTCLAAWLRLKNGWQVAHDMGRDGCRPSDPIVNAKEGVWDRDV